MYSDQIPWPECTTSQRELFLEDREIASEEAWEDLCRYITTMGIVILNAYFMTPGVVTPSCVKSWYTINNQQEWSCPCQWSQFLHSREKAIKYKTWKHFIYFHRFCHKCRICFPFLSESEDILWEKQFSCLCFSHEIYAWGIVMVKSMGLGVRKWIWFWFCTSYLLCGTGQVALSY